MSIQIKQRKNSPVVLLDNIRYIIGEWLQDFISYLNIINAFDSLAKERIVMLDEMIASHYFTKDMALSLYKLTYMNCVTMPEVKQIQDTLIKVNHSDIYNESIFILKFIKLRFRVKNVRSGKL
jgi:hypothetical protein